ncbi:hypothetical protein HYU90_03250 [Candidatus Collierbacteria bacterium]|nr:hypothetical protein [Candidatus Collierbacteria bacterium]
MDKIPLFLEAFANTPYIYALLIADLILRGLALYKSARKEQRIWFVSLLVVNSLGLLPLVYLFLNRIPKVSTATPAKKTIKRKTKK